MNYPKYDFTSSTDNVTFEFVSDGSNGAIKKVINYQLLDKDKQIFNLCFGDNLGINPDTGELNIDDIVVSKNGDMEKVLATVASSVYLFAKTYPDKLIFFQGSTESRTRLYRKAISKVFDEISKTLDIFGAILKDGKVLNVPFSTNGNFYGFFIKAKIENNGEQI